MDIKRATIEDSFSITKCQECGVTNYLRHDENFAGSNVLVEVPAVGFKCYQCLRHNAFFDDIDDDIDDSGGISALTFVDGLPYVSFAHRIVKVPKEINNG